MADQERVEQLLEIVSHHLLHWNPGADLNEYHDWDSLIECDEVLTFEEWEWCRDNMKVERSVSVSIVGEED